MLIQGLRCFAAVASLAFVGRVANDVRHHFHLNYLVIFQESKKMGMYMRLEKEITSRDRIFGSLPNEEERVQNSKGGPLLDLCTFCNQETTSGMFEALLRLAAFPSLGLAAAVVFPAPAFTCCNHCQNSSNPPAPVGAKGRVFPEALATGSFSWGGGPLLCR